MSDQLDDEIERLADQLAEEAVDGKLSSNQLLTREQLKAKLKEEYKNELLAKEDGEKLEQAVAIILNEGDQYLNKTEVEKIHDDFLKAHELAGDTITLSEETVHAIEKMALELFHQKEFSKACHLFFLLHTLNPQFLFLLRQGMSLQEAGDISKALAVYAQASLLDPDKRLPHLFAAECHLQEGRVDEAKSELELAKACLEGPEDQESAEYLTQINDYLKDLG